MKRAWLLMAVLVAGGIALAQNGPLLASKTFTFSCPTDGGTCTGSAPTASDDGVDLRDGVGYNVILDTSPDGGGVTPSSGSLACYTYAPIYSTGVHGSSVIRKWAPCKSSLNITSIAAQRPYQEPTFSMGVGSGRVKYVPSSLVVSSLSALPDGGANVGLVDVNVTIEVQRAPRPTR